MSLDIFGKNLAPDLALNLVNICLAVFLVLDNYFVVPLESVYLLFFSIVLMDGASFAILDCYLNLL